VRYLREQALFGLIDGLNGAVGLAIGLLRLHSAADVILVALLARAGSSAVSMAGAQYQADESGDTHLVRMSRVAAMGLGYLTSAIAPGLERAKPAVNGQRHHRELHHAVVRPEIKAVNSSSATMTRLVDGPGSLAPGRTRK
jgi:hypothetical protein